MGDVVTIFGKYNLIHVPSISLGRSSHFMSSLGCGGFSDVCFAHWPASAVSVRWLLGPAASLLPLLADIDESWRREEAGSSQAQSRCSARECTPLGIAHDTV